VGLLIAAMAIVSQLALGAVVLPDNRPSDPVAALDALSVLCQTGHPPSDKPAPAHRAPQSALCPLNVTLAAPATILLPTTTLPTPSATPALRTASPQPARPPRSQADIAAYPRGPPVLA
jgi:hypothetical protein